MSYTVLDSTTSLTSNGAAGNVYTYQVVGNIGDSIRFEGTNFPTWTHPVTIATVTLSSTTEAFVATHSWMNIRAVVLSGTPSYVVSSDTEV